VLLGLALFLAYSINLRPIGSSDTVGAALLPLCIIRGDGPFLDRFGDFLHTAADGRLGWSYTESRGHLLSCYPLGPALLAVPFTLPQVWLLDAFVPGWEEQAHWYCVLMSKSTAAAIAALVGVTLLYLLRALGLGRVALPAVLAAALGSDLWAVASQSMWQHGPAALALSLSMLLLATRNPSRLRLCLAGLAAAALVCFRSIDIVFAGTILLWVAWRHPRGLVWFLPLPIVVGGALVSFNYWYFGAIEGGQALIEATHAELHGFRGSWSGNLLEGMAGTLFSPNRGLFVFTPWVAVALAAVPATAGRLRPWSLIRCLLVALVPYLLILSMYGCWWGGKCFGPRFWTDAIPLFTVLLAAGLEWSRAGCRPGFWALVLTITLSSGVQVIGAFCYPSSWERSPVDIDRHHERLWDWRDTELSRCLTEGRK
jgi:hypothetical protein